MQHHLLALVQHALQRLEVGSLVDRLERVEVLPAPSSILSGNLNIRVITIKNGASRAEILASVRYLEGAKPNKTRSRGRP